MPRLVSSNSPFLLQKSIPSQRKRQASKTSSASSMTCRLLVLSIAILFPYILHTTTTPTATSHSLPSSIQILPTVDAKEIIATHQWQKIGENDTIPAGLHVKMDLTTGEKWAKIATPDDGDDESKMAAPGAIDAEISHDGALTIIDNNENDDATAKTTANSDGGEKENEEFAPQRDYEMMHRVMSSLPPEELERFGGLPALPSSDENSITKLTQAEREAFEQKMEILWQKRQEELKKFQEEHIANLPKILEERIATLKGYLADVEGGLEKLLVEREKKRQAEEDGNDDVNVEEDEDDGAPVIANDVISALRDLEFQLSDVDMARDFHTLGGWPYLVALLSDDLHHAPSRGGNQDHATTKYNGKEDEVLTIIDEIQSLAAMTIGTAVGNLGEFRPWALEDVSAPIQQFLNQTTNNNSDKEQTSQPISVSALSLLTNTFLEELNLRSSHMMNGMSMAVPTEPYKNNKDSAEKSRATFKLRAIYALGSLLRGNPPAQQIFVSQLAGPDILIRNVLGTLSTVRGPNSNKALAKLDYKFASRVLALGEDLVMDVVLHGETYVVVDEETPLEVKEGYADERIVTANQLVAAFTSERWCDLSLRLLSAPLEVVGVQGAIGMKERALSAVRALGPRCKEGYAGGIWGVEEVKKVRKEINREGSGDGLDPSFRKELLELVDGVLETLQ